MLFLTPTYPIAVLYGLRIVALFNELQFYKKRLRIINFQPRNFHISPLFKQNSILKFHNKICLKYFIYQQNFYHRKFLIHGLVFPQINITMKHQLLLRVISQNFFIRQEDMGSIQ